MDGCRRLDQRLRRGAPSGGADAHDSLRKVLGFTGAQIVEDAFLRLPLARGDVGEDGLIAPEEARAEIVGALTASPPLPSSRACACGDRASI